MTGPTFADAWGGRVSAEFAPGVSVPVIGLDALLENKRAAGRPQDLADVAALERLRRLRAQG